MFDFIAFDADDTLWHNETIFHAAHEEFRRLLSRYHDSDWIDKRLYMTEEKNLSHFGYGIKGFTLSMIETAIELTEGRISGTEVKTIIDLGKGMLGRPIELLDGVEETVKQLADFYPLVLITKGDLFDQESKLARSGLGEYFSFVEIVSEKNVDTYRTVMTRLQVEPERFLMVGNSVRSDVLPVLEAGGKAVYIAYPLTWAHEVVPENDLAGKQFVRLERISDLPDWLEQVSNNSQSARTPASY